MRREPFAARRGFYPASPKALAAELDRCMPEVKSPRRAAAVVVPHAGYAYSGLVAGKVYAAVEVPEHVVVLCPKHTRFGSPMAVMTSGSWAVPGAEIPIDEELASRVREACELDEDAEAHLAEHSLEVQLPFLHRRNPAFKLTPIALGVGGWTVLGKLGRRLAETVRSFGKPVLLVASSDLSHESGNRERVKRNDALAIERMVALDAEGLVRVVEEHDITMCGFAPAAAVLAAARALGATRAELLGYETSLDHGGTEDWIVGYAGLVIE
ncbi:MAG: AmmeMemoRadiSam system protein B [Deltaproteobacteria bacterium]|nr:AmmeMemoRadiSam system protein B [Deltaproteobacteria bacterium]